MKTNFKKKELSMYASTEPKFVCITFGFFSSILICLTTVRPKTFYFFFDPTFSKSG